MGVLSFLLELKCQYVIVRKSLENDGSADLDLFVVCCEVKSDSNKVFRLPVVLYEEKISLNRL